MAAKKLVKQLRRELLGSPKKAAFLGTMALAAAYLWGPLLWGWIVKPNPATGGGAADSAGVSAATPQSPQSPQSPQGPQPSTPAEKTEMPPIRWQQLVQYMQSDPRTVAAKSLAQQRNPFATAKSKGPAAPTTPPLAMNPQGLGLELSSTIVGPGRRIARISGKTYAEGKTIEVSKNGQHVVLTLAEVHPRRVVLTWEGGKLDLSIPLRKQ